jgi:hypothetical protein
MLIALVFWLGVKDTAVGDSLVKNWAKVLDCAVFVLRPVGEFSLRLCVPYD